MTVYDTLHTLVLAGGIRPDEKIAESQLAERLGVSRTPVREALQRLEGDGLIVAQGRGVRLRTLDAQQLRDAHVARAGLEGWAAFLAAQRVARGEIAPVRLAELDELARRTDELTASGDLEQAATANRVWHESLAALAENAPVSEALRRWWDQIVVSTGRSLEAPERTPAVRDEHEGILRALRAGDAAAARAAVERHALGTLSTLDRDDDELRSAR